MNHKNVKVTTTSGFDGVKIGSAEKLQLICFTILFCPKAGQTLTFCLHTESRSPPGSKAKRTNNVCNQRFSADPK